MFHAMMFKIIDEFMRNEYLNIYIPLELNNNYYLTI